jgi:hypothetical protein
MQDGENDLNIYGGDWWMANQEMQRALVFAGYDVKHAWGRAPSSMRMKVGCRTEREHNTSVEPCGSTSLSGRT